MRSRLRLISLLKMSIFCSGQSQFRNRDDDFTSDEDLEDSFKELDEGKKELEYLLSGFQNSHRSTVVSRRKIFLVKGVCM